MAVQACFDSCLVSNPEHRFSRNKAHRNNANMTNSETVKAGIG